MGFFDRFYRKTLRMNSVRSLWISTRVLEFLMPSSQVFRWSLLVRFVLPHFLIFYECVASFWIRHLYSCGMFVFWLGGRGGGGLIFETNLFAMYRLMNLWRFVILDWRWDFHNSSTYGNASSQVNRFVGCALCSVCYDCKLALSDLMVEVLYIILSFTQIIFVFDNAVLLPGMPFSFILDVFKVKIVVHVN